MYLTNLYTRARRNTSSNFKQNLTEKPSAIPRLTSPICPTTYLPIVGEKIVGGYLFVCLRFMAYQPS